MLWPPDAKNWLIGRDPDAGKDWRQEEEGMTEDELVRWHHWLNGHEFDQTPLGDSEGQGSLVLQSMGSQRVGHDWATELTTELTVNSYGQKEEDASFNFFCRIVPRFNIPLGFRDWVCCFPSWFLTFEDSMRTTSRWAEERRHLEATVWSEHRVPSKFAFRKQNNPACHSALSKTWASGKAPNLQGQKAKWVAGNISKWREELKFKLKTWLTGIKEISQKTLGLAHHFIQI